MKKVAVIGSGFAGLSSATYLASKGYEVKVFEKNELIGGRARKFHSNGFTFDMGPSWYWMPDIFENYFKDFGYQASDFYDLKRLDPSYRVFFGDNDVMDLPASMEELYELFEKEEKGSKDKLIRFLNSAEYKYNVGIKEFANKPGLRLTEFLNRNIVSQVFKMNLTQNVRDVVYRDFKSPKLRSILEFPVLFLGERAEKIPAMYTLMNYADMKLGTWYPMGGMHKIIEAFQTIAERQGVEFITNSEIEKINVKDGFVQDIYSKRGIEKTNAVVATADYNHVEQQLLDDQWRNYSKKYWDKRVMAPSSLIFYLGINKKLKNLLHHNLFFDEDFQLHSKEIYDTPIWPSAPLFYVSAPSVTDPSVAPEGHENLFILIPVAPDLDDPETTREYYFQLVMNRLEKLTNQSIKEHIIYKRSYAHKDFKKDYHAFKGNAYGLANTLKQTAVFKPSVKNSKVSNLYYSGQLTVPGPGVPPSIISGQIAANLISKELNS